MNNTMELNKETANRLWVKQFGKRQKALTLPDEKLPKLPTTTETVISGGMLTTFFQNQRAVKPPITI